ncbi:MAG TPA: response regulator transcription factor [Thermoflexia bacterium]|jgi:DNA-binding response OmpR family regulator|nr:response regulator transcription factor [Thermoflexia bacterium]
MRETVLVIDDDPQLLGLLRLTLEREGFRVVTAESGEEGLRRAYEARPDAIVLDIMMPEMDGWAVCRRLRDVCDVPILILSARTETESVIRGFSLGADDYLSKPCSLEELVFRIRAILRRARTDTKETWQEVYDDGTLYIDLANGRIEREGTPIHLTPTEQRLLTYLVRQEGRVVPHRELLTNVWGPEYAEEVGYLSVYIRYLRRKIEADPSAPRYIRTRWGIGYYFAGNHLLEEEQSLRSVQDE